MKKKLFFLTLLLAGTGIWLFASQGTDADKFVPEETPAAGEEKVKLNKIARELVKSCQHRRWAELERAFAVTREERELAIAETGEDSVKAGLALLKQHAFQMSPEKFQMSHLKKNRRKMFLRMALDNNTVLCVTLLEQKGKLYLSSVSEKKQEKL